MQVLQQAMGTTGNTVSYKNLLIPNDYRNPLNRSVVTPRTPGAAVGSTTR